MFDAATGSLEAASPFERARARGHERALPARRGWLEFLAIGGVTLFLLPLAWLAERTLGLELAEFGVGFSTFYAAHVLNDPHFSVTYLLFYRDIRERAWGNAFSRLQRARYVLAGFGVPLVLTAWACFAIAQGSARALGYLMELMFVLVGWHYVKQGFGVLLVLSARRGVRYTLGERRALLAHCFLGWAFAWANPSTAARDVEERGLVYRALAHPRLFELGAGALFALSTLVLVASLWRKYRREGRPAPLAPLAGFLVSVWLWTIFSSLDPLLIYVIPALHSLQYLYFVKLLRKNQALQEEAAPTFGRPVRERLALLALSAIALGWLQFHALPDLLDGAKFLLPQRSPAALADLGPTPWFASFFAIVNIHHYFMDTVIWRRENPETRFLYDQHNTAPRPAETRLDVAG